MVVLMEEDGRCTFGAKGWVILFQDSMCGSGAATAVAAAAAVRRHHLMGGSNGAALNAFDPLLHTTTPLRQFQCPYCAKLFLKKFNLLTHVRIHTGERPFACPYCQYRANHSSHLKTHIFKLHTNALSAVSSLSVPSTASSVVTSTPSLPVLSSALSGVTPISANYSLGQPNSSKFAKTAPEFTPSSQVFLGNFDASTEDLRLQGKSTSKS